MAEDTYGLLRNRLEIALEDLECVHMYLDDLGVPREDDGGTFSIVGRIKWLQANPSDAPGPRLPVGADLDEDLAALLLFQKSS